MDEESAHFDKWKQQNKLKAVDPSTDQVANYFASMSASSGLEPEYDIQDGYLNCFLTVGGNGRTLVRIKQEDPSEDPPATWELLRMYREGDPSLEVIIDNEVLMKHHKDWLMDSWGIPEQFEVCSLSSTSNGMIAYSIRVERKERQWGIFVRNFETDTMVESIFPEDIKFSSSVPDIHALLQKDDGIVELDGCAALVLAQAADGTPMLFYAMMNGHARPFSVVRHRLGDVNHHEVVLYEPSPEIYVDLRKTIDLQYLTLYSGTNQESQVSYLPLNQADAELKVIERRQKGLRYFVEHHSGFFYVFTNRDGHENLRIMRTPVENPSMDNWQYFGGAEEEDVRIVEVEVLHKGLVLFETLKGDARIRVVNVESGDSQVYPLPLKYGELQPSVAVGFNMEHIFFSLSSVVSPKDYFRLDLNTGEMDNYAPPVHVPLFRKDNFKLYQVMAPSSQDSSLNIPITVAHHKRIDIHSGENKIILVGYGAYREHIAYPFHHHFAMLLNRGFILAFAHCRGGGELGQSWYDSGRLFNKKNTFRDFVDCAQFLVKEGWTQEKMICARGTSAGALTVAAAANMRPELFGSLVMHVPFLDVVTTMSDASLPNTVAEFEEFGDASQPEMRKYMTNYAPIENLGKVVSEHQYFPNTYISTSISDENTPIWNALKYVAQLRTELHKNQMQDKVKVLLNQEDDKGHSEYSPNFLDMCDGVRSEHCFIMSNMPRVSEFSAGEQP